MLRGGLFTLRAEAGVILCAAGGLNAYYQIARFHTRLQCCFDNCQTSWWPFRTTLWGNHYAAAFSSADFFARVQRRVFSVSEIPESPSFATSSNSDPLARHHRTDPSFDPLVHINFAPVICLLCKWFIIMPAFHAHYGQNVNYKMLHGFR